MAFFRNLKHNLASLQDIFRKRKRSLSASSTSRRPPPGPHDNSENNPVRLSTSQQHQTPALLQDVTQSPTSSSSPTGVDGESSDKAQGSSASIGRRAEQSLQNRLLNLASPGVKPASRPSPSADAQRASASPGGKPSSRSSTDAVESDSEPEEKGVPRCYCSRNSPFSKTSEIPLALLSANFAEEIYGESDTACRSVSSENEHQPYHRQRNTPSTSRQPVEPGGGARGSHTDMGHSSCSQEDQLMEQMVTVLKTRGSLGSHRRSRSRSRRSRPRQNHENTPTGFTMNNIRVTHNQLHQQHNTTTTTTAPVPPRRETDSDESNTSFNDLPISFLPSSRHYRLNNVNTTTTNNTSSADSRSNVQSDSSFHSATAGGSDDPAPPPRPSSFREEQEEAEEADVEGAEWEGGGVNSTTDHNRSRGGQDGSGVLQQLEELELELASYGPEEFVLDLMLAMCRGTWSDIL